MKARRRAGRRWGWVFVGGVMAWVTSALGAQTQPSHEVGRLIQRTYTSAIDGARVDYALWLPPEYESRQAWPMIVFLHGSGEGVNWKSPTKPAASIPVVEAMNDLPFIVAFPLMRGSWSISTLAERDVLDTIEDVKANFAVDADRVHLVGLSLGGFAAWRIACRYPHVFASLSAFCGGGEPGLAVNLRHIATQVFHGTLDPSVPVDRSREMVSALRQAEIPVEYAEYPRSQHAVWREPLHSPAFYEWLGRQERARNPRRLSYRTYTLRHSTAYWATIDSMVDPAAPAFLDVFVPPGESTVLVHTENVGGVVLNPPPVILDGGGPVRFVVNDEPAEPRKIDGGWLVVTAPLQTEGLAKRPGLSGPIQDVFYDRFLVTTGDRDTSAAGLPWRQVAADAFRWTGQLVYGNVQFMEADALTPKQMSDAHLICFGDTDSHPLLAELKGRLPLHSSNGLVFLNGEALSPWVAGFVMIYPNPLAPEHYVVVCSGRPEAVAVLASAVLTPAALNPPRVEDLVLIGRDGRIIDWRPVGDAREAQAAPMGARLEGRGPVFDRLWKLTPEAVDWLRGIGENNGIGN